MAYEQNWKSERKQPFVEILAGTHENLDRAYKLAEMLKEYNDFKENESWGYLKIFIKNTFVELSLKFGTDDFDEIDFYFPLNMVKYFNDNAIYFEFEGKEYRLA